jgi:hypothetical protein
MAKKIVPEEHGLTDVAVAVGSALGKLAQKIGLGEAPAPPAPKPPVKAATRKPPAAKKKAAPKRKVAAKKVAAKRPNTQKAKSPAKKK